MDLQLIQNRIYNIRGHKVMLDFDLAVLYNVETSVLNQAVILMRNGFAKLFIPYSTA